MLLISGPSFAAPSGDACSGIHLRSGKVSLGRPLAVASAPDAETKRCLEAIGRALANRAGLRTVTLIGQLPNALRVDGKAKALLEGYVDLLAKGGLSKARISWVAPRSRDGDGPQIEIAFTEKRAQLPVAVLTAAKGEFSAGKERGRLESVRVGTALMVQTYVRTGPDTIAMLDLADGSRLRMSGGTLLLLGRLHLDAELKRVVDLKLVSGNVSVDVARRAAGGAFRIETKHGIAGVRGTRFRLDLGNGKATRLETVTGEVELAGSRAKVRVPAGMGSSVDATGKPIKPRALPSAPTLEAPLKGPWKRATPLRWNGVRKATGYRVELAKDAEFSLDPMTLATKKTTLLLPAKLKSGKWFWRVRAVDAAGFVGLDSKIYAFSLAP